MPGQVALITGANRGLGSETARQLAARGYHVVLTARNPADGESAVARIQAAVPGARAQSLPLDVASFASIRGFVEAFRALGLPLHVLVNNAGVITTAARPSFTVEGFELTLGTNHVGPALLTHLLLPDLARAAPSRIVIVSSAMHRQGVGPGPGPDFDYDNLKGEKSFHPVTAYRNSRLANLWFASELARRLRGKMEVAVLALSPGWVPETQAAAAPSAVQRFLFRYVLPHMPFARTVKEGSDTIVYVATEPGLQAQSGGFFEDRKPGVMSAEAHDEMKARRLWDETMRWCGIAGEYGAVGAAAA